MLPKLKEVKVLNTPTLKDAKAQLEYFIEKYKARPDNIGLANLNRAYMVYQTKLIEQEKK